MSRDDAGAEQGGTPESFDRYARMLQRATGAAVTLVTLIEPERGRFVGAQGLPPEVDATREVPLSHSFCRHVVADRDSIVAQDVRMVERLADNGAIEDFGVRSYAGWPLRDHTGAVVGSLCAMEMEVREWSAGDIESLEDIAEACSTELAQRALVGIAAEGEARAQHLNDRSSVLLALSEGLSTTRTLVDVAAAVERVSVDELGCVRAGIWLRDFEEPLRRDALPSEVGPLPPGASVAFVEPMSPGWESAQRFPVLPVDLSNPIGRAILEGPVEFPDVATQNKLYPHLTNPQQIGEGRTFLPLQARGHVYGTLVLVWPDARVFPVGARVTFGALASYTAQAVQRAQLFQERLEALVTLQSAMMSQLPDPKGLSLAARYRPAAERDQVGGDWYDAVVMPSGAAALMIGDVVGHDIAAAAVMGQLRNMLRALAWALEDAPSYNVARLDRAMDELGVEGMASLVYARLEQSDEDRLTGAHTLRWTNAGHPPPLLIAADGTTRWLEVADTDLMVGVSPEGSRGDHRARVEPGATILLFTDGLVERRGEDITDGLDRLAAAARRHHGLAVNDFLDAIMGDLLGLWLGDDVAVLAVRVDPVLTSEPRR